MYSVVNTNTKSVAVEINKSTLVVHSKLLGPLVTEEEEMVYSKRVDFVSENLIYRGEALVGGSEASPSWRIRRIEISPSDGDIVEKWADGSANFTKIWNNRLTYTYS